MIEGNTITMYSLNDVIKKCDLEEMISGNLVYEDYIPYHSEEMDCTTNEYTEMRYYEGLISVEEHKEYNCNTTAYSIYDKYIFNEVDVFSNVFKIDDSEIDDLIYFRIMLSQESPYLEKFDQLMFRIYFEKKKEQLAGLVQNILEKYDWAKNYIEIYRQHNCSILFQSNTETYKKQFGIIEEKEDVKSNILINDGKKIPPKEKDWISKFVDRQG